MRSSDNSYAIHPRRALDALAKAGRDPDDSKEVARFIGAVQGRWPLRTLRRIRRTKKGRQLLREKPDLLHRLKDTEYLAALPEGTLGRAYYEFCRREHLTPGALDEALEGGMDWERFERVSEDERFLSRWMRDTHDLLHVVTGYRTDVVGEIAVLTFMATQTRNPGVLVLVILGQLGLLTNGLASPRFLANAVARALRARTFFLEDWTALLEQPLDEVRRKLRVGTVPHYEPLYTPANRMAMGPA